MSSLSEKDKKRIEEEEIYRAQVRSELKKKKREKEQPKRKASWWKPTPAAKVFLISMVVIFFILIFRGSPNKNSDSSPNTEVNDSQAELEKEAEMKQKKAQELAMKFCEERGSQSVRFVNFDDYSEMFSKAPQKVTLRPGETPPTQESCKRIANICLEMWPEDECKNIAEKKIWINMTENQLILSWGLPNDRNNTTGAWGVHSQWVYGNPIYGGSYVYLEGKDKDSMKVTSWQD